MPFGLMFDTHRLQQLGQSSTLPCLPSMAEDDVSVAAPRALTVGRLRVFKHVITNAQMS